LLLALTWLRGCPRAQAVAHDAASGALALLSARLAPPSAGSPAGAQPKRLQLHSLWTATLVRAPAAAVTAQRACACGTAVH
jgi:hypothetical protein